MAAASENFGPRGSGWCCSVGGLVGLPALRVDLNLTDKLGRYPRAAPSVAKMLGAGPLQCDNRRWFKVSDEIKFVPYAVARKIVGEIVDEEHLHDPDRRIMTVYDVGGRELCWFDTAEIMADLGITKTDSDQAKEAAVDYAFHHIPVWAVAEILKGLEKKK